MLHQFHRRPVVYIHGKDNLKIDISRFVVTVTTQRSIGQPVSNCTVTLVNTPGDHTSGNDSLFLSASEWISLIKRIVRPQQIVSVQMYPEEEFDEDGSPVYVEETFIGLIDILHQNENYEGGQPSISYQFSAAGLLGKILTKETIVGSQVLAMFKFPELEKALGQKSKDFFNMVRGLTAEGGSVFIGNPKPSGAIQYIVSNAIRFREFLAVKPDGTADMVEFDIGTANEASLSQILDITTLKYEYLFGVELSVYTGTIWNYILRTLDTRFYEAFIDTTQFKIQDTSYVRKDYVPKTPIVETREKIVIRPIPFSYRFMDKIYETDELNKRLQEDWSYWEDLPYCAELYRSDLLSTDLSKSDAQHFNWFTMTYNNSIIAPPGSTLATFGYAAPLINIQGVKEFGLRELSYETKNPFNYKELQDSINKAKKEDKPAEIKDEGQSVLALNLQSKKNRVMEWNSFPYYEYGQISVNGSRKYRIGTKIKLLEQEYSYTLRDENGKVKEYFGKGMEYYVTAVEHSSTVGRDTRTRLTLSKGIPIIEGDAEGNPVRDYLSATYKNRIDVGKEYAFAKYVSDEKIREEDEKKKELEKQTALTAKPDKELKGTK